MKDILVIGGYGDVGKHVVEELLSITSKNIIVAGRNVGKATRFIQEQQNKRVNFMKLDIYNTFSYTNKLDNVELVIMCLNPTENSFAKYCLQNSIHYIDISPSNQISSDLENMDLECKQKQVQCILGVGISPGLSTLLTKDIASHFDSIIETHMSLMLSMADNYGKDAIKWLLDNFSKPFICVQKGKTITKNPCIKRKKVTFTPPIGTRHAFEFNLADQQIITNHLSHNNVSTFFCYDLKLFTWLAHILAKLGVFKLTKYAIFYYMIASFINLSMKIVKPFSSDVFAINVTVTGYQDGKLTTSTGNILGNNSPLATGKVIAYTANHAMNEKDRAGVYYLHELYHLTDYEKHYNHIFTTQTNTN